MQIALLPLPIDYEKPRANLEKIAHFVAGHYRDSLMLVLPQIDLDPGEGGSRHRASPEVFSQYQDVLSLMAQKRHVPLVGGLLTGMPVGRRQTLFSINRSGQWDAGSRQVENPDIVPAAPVVIGGWANQLRVALVAPEDIDEQHKELMKRLSDWPQLDVIAVPLHLRGTPAEVGRVALHNPPEALPTLLENLGALAQEAGAWVLAVNAIGADRAGECGPCGGAWAFSPDGRCRQERELFDENPLLVDVH